MEPEYARFDVEITRVNGTDDAQRWVSRVKVVQALMSLEDGDDMVVHHVGYADAGVVYAGH